MTYAEFIDSAIAAAGLIFLIVSIFLDEHARIYLAILAVLMAGLSGMFA